MALPLTASRLFCCIISVHNLAMIGYARVSANGQNGDAQVKQLRLAGADKIFRETTRGAQTDRAQLRRLVSRLAKGDVLLVTRLDRLARSTLDLLNRLAPIDKGAGFRLIRDAGADTTTPLGRLMSTVLGGLSELKRELIRTRTGKSRERATARGVKMGRRSTLTDHQRREAMKRMAAGEATREIARSYNVSQSTISRLAPGPFGAFSAKG